MILYSDLLWSIVLQPLHGLLLVALVLLNGHRQPLSGIMRVLSLEVDKVLALGGLLVDAETGSWNLLDKTHHLGHGGFGKQPGRNTI